MAQIETWFDQDFRSAVKVRYIDGNVFSQDNNGNLIGVNMFYDGAPYNLFGTVSANVIRPDGATIAVSGTVTENKAFVVLPQSAYAVPGVISIIIKLESNSDVTTLCAVVANVYVSSTDTSVDPGTIIPSISDLIASIENAVSTIPADYSNLNSIAKIPSLCELDSELIEPGGNTIRNLFSSLTYASNVGLSSSNFYNSTIADYLTHTTASTGTKLYEPVRIRSDAGVLLGNVYGYIGNIIGDPNIAFGFKKDGTHDRTYKSADIVNNIFVFDSTTYFVVFVQYSSFTYDIYAKTGYIKDVLKETNGIILDSSVLELSDLVINANYNYGKALSSANFYKSTIFNYTSLLTDSSITSTSTPICVRDVNGNQISPIYCEYDDTIYSANIAFGFNSEGRYDYIYKAEDVVDGELVLNNTTYYLIVLTYYNVWTSLKSKFNYDKSIRHYSVGSGQQFSTYTECIRAIKHDKHEKVVDIYGGTYDILAEMGGRDFLNTLSPSDKWYDVSDIVPPNTHVLGHGNVVLTLTIPEDIAADIKVHLSPVNVRGSATIENITINCTNARYCVHAEGSQFPQFNNAVWRFINCRVNGSEIGSVFGVGINDGDLMEVRDCIVTNDGNQGIMIHDQQVNSGSLPVSPRIIITNCAIDVPYYPIVLSSTHSGSVTGAVLEVSVINCAVNNKFMRKIGDGHKDVFAVTYINTPHRTQNGSGLIDIIPDVEYNNYALPSQ